MEDSLLILTPVSICPCGGKTLPARQRAEHWRERENGRFWRLAFKSLGEPRAQCEGSAAVCPGPVGVALGQPFETCSVGWGGGGGGRFLETWWGGEFGSS